MEAKNTIQRSKVPMLDTQPSPVYKLKRYRQIHVQDGDSKAFNGAFHKLLALSGQLRKEMHTVDNLRHKISGITNTQHQNNRTSKNRCTTVQKSNGVTKPAAEGQRFRSCAAAALTGLREEGVEGVITPANGLVRRHLAIGLDAVLEAVKLPASVTFFVFFEQ